LEINYGPNSLDLRLLEELAPAAAAAAGGAPNALTRTQAAALQWFSIQQSLPYVPFGAFHERFHSFEVWRCQEAHTWALVLERLCEPSNGLLMSLAALLWALRGLRRHWRTFDNLSLKRELWLLVHSVLLLPLLALLG
jgi:hypothetical protein